MFTVSRNQDNKIIIFVDSCTPDFSLSVPFCYVQFEGKAITIGGKTQDTYVVADCTLLQSNRQYEISFYVESDITNEDRDAGIVYLEDQAHYRVSFYDFGVIFPDPLPEPKYINNLYVNKDNG